MISISDSISIYAQNRGAPKYIRQILAHLKCIKEISKVVGDHNISFDLPGRKSIRKHGS